MAEIDTTTKPFKVSNDLEYLGLESMTPGMTTGSNELLDAMAESRVDALVNMDRERFVPEKVFNTLYDSYVVMLAKFIHPYFDEYSSEDKERVLDRTRALANEHLAQALEKAEDQKIHIPEDIMTKFGEIGVGQHVAIAA